MLTYGLVCRLASLEGVPALEALKDLMREWYDLKEREKPEDKLYEIREDVYLDEGRSVWQFVLAENADDNAIWTTEVRAAALPDSPGTLAVTIAMRIESADPRLAPVRYYITSPRFVRRLAERFAVSLGPTVANPVPTCVADAEGAKALLEELADQERTLPLLVLARPADDSPVGVHLPEFLARFVFSLANVVVLEPDAIPVFASAVGSRHACFDGEARIYWPAWSKTDDPQRHPRYDADTLEGWARLRPEAPHEIVRTKLLTPLISASVGRFSYPTEIHRTISRVEGARAVEKHLDAERGELLSTIWRLTAERDQARGTSERLDAEKQGWLDFLERTQAELQQTRGELERFRELYPDAPLEKRRALSVATALQKARADFAETLVLPNNGYYDDTSMPGDKVYGILQALHELCLIERSGQAKDKKTLVRDLMVKRTGAPARYKFADTQAYIRYPDGKREVHLRDRAHVETGSQGNWESVYWTTVGPTRPTYQYLVGRIGPHA